MHVLNGHQCLHLLVWSCRYTQTLNLKHQSTNRHAADSESTNSLLLFINDCMLSREVFNTNFKVFGWTRSRLEPTIYMSTRGLVFQV
jgi:hypothetical protein